MRRGKNQQLTRCKKFSSSEILKRFPRVESQEISSSEKKFTCPNIWTPPFSFVFNRYCFHFQRGFLLWDFWRQKKWKIFPGICRDEKRNLRFPCIQWKRERNFVPVSTVYKGNANFVFRPWEFGDEKRREIDEQKQLGVEHRLKIDWSSLGWSKWVEN